MEMLFITYLEKTNRKKLKKRKNGKNRKNWRKRNLYFSQKKKKKFFLYIFQIKIFSIIKNLKSLKQYKN